MIIELTTLAASAALAGLAARATHMAASLLTDPTFGCLTRAGITRRWRPGMVALFFDLDGLHDLNATYGYEEVDRRIRAALAVCRRDEAAVGRWYSGDEFVVIVPTVEAAHAVEQRLRVALADVGLSATFAASLGTTLGAAVSSASSVVQLSKSMRGAA